MNIKIDISVCRVCLKSGDGKSLFSDHDADKLGDKFKYVTQTKVKNVVELSRKRLGLIQSSHRIYVVIVDSPQPATTNQLPFVNIFFVKFPLYFGSVYIFQLIKGDGLPERLCNQCVRRLKLAFEFRKQSESSAAQLKSFITKVNKQFTQVATVRDNENEEEADLDDYLFEGEFDEQSQDESSDVQPTTKLKDLNVVEITSAVHKIKAESVEAETIEEIIFENNEDEIGENSNEDIEGEQIEEVIMDNEVYEEEHLLDEVYLEEQVNRHCAIRHSIHFGVL